MYAQRIAVRRTAKESRIRSGISPEYAGRIGLVGGGLVGIGRRRLGGDWSAAAWWGSVGGAAAAAELELASRDCAAAGIAYHWPQAARTTRGLCMLMKTYVATPADRERNWLLVDASGQTLGRLATRIADTLRGKRKPTYTPHVDTGDFVIVVNAEKIAVTGNKRSDKRYYRHSGYPGGLKSRSLNEMLERRPEEVIRLAVKGMLPRNRLARKQLTKLKVYAGPEHPHAAQQPQPMEIQQ
jgi:large subunit ribosomal protein L13